MMQLISRRNLAKNILIFFTFLVFLTVCLRTRNHCKSQGFRVNIITNTVPSRPAVKNTEKTLPTFTKKLEPKRNYNKLLKYALLWYYHPAFKEGQQTFIENECSYTNCYITRDRTYLPDITDFDAVLFNIDAEGYEMQNNPIKRSPRQKYIAIATEAPINYDYWILFRVFNNFFNLTWSYKLNSDILWRYFIITDNYGTEIGPRLDTKWLEHFEPTGQDVIKKLRLKTKAAAWLVSHCTTDGKRENYVKQLYVEMGKLNLTLDVYGKCGVPCDDCYGLIERDYYFYLAFENTFNEDYVTEKILNAVQYYTVPVVLGGANYSRFLPPGSYLNANQMTPLQLANTMNEVISNFTSYQDYFRWTNHYKYEFGTLSELCNLCETLNDEKIMKTSTVRELKNWWMGRTMVRALKKRLVKGLKLLRKINNSKSKLDALSVDVTRIYDLD